MYVVAVGADLFKFDVVSLFDRFGGFQNCSAHLWCQERLAVLDRKDEVIVRIVYVVVAAGDAHAHRIPENRAFSDFRLWNPAPEGRGMFGFTASSLIVRYDGARKERSSADVVLAVN